MCLPRFVYNGTDRVDNITDWTLDRFCSFYPTSSMNKDRIFYYAYGVMNDPQFHAKFALNLRRGFPELPFYSDFDLWSEWGKSLLHLHIQFETAEPFEFERVEATAGVAAPKPLLRSDQQTSLVQIDSQTTLAGIPKQAFRYRLGSRTAIDWVLDQYKEKSISDGTDIAKLHDYRFASHKEECILTIGRVVTLALETVHIFDAMQAYPEQLRSPPSTSTLSAGAKPDAPAPSS